MNVVRSLYRYFAKGQKDEQMNDYIALDDEQLLRHNFRIMTESIVIFHETLKSRGIRGRFAQQLVLAWFQFSLSNIAIENLRSSVEEFMKEN